MNRNISLLPLLILMLSCGRSGLYEISNPADIDLKDKAFVVSRSEIKSFLEDSLQPVLAMTQNGEWLPGQCDDLDGDGKWDELAFLCDMKANETVKILFKKPDSAVQFPVRTNIRFGRMNKPFEEVNGDLRMKTNDTKFTAPVYQMEGPAWENDLIAFRNYYDARNGIDIFGKMTADMVMDSVGVNGREYHSLHDWGMDILKVGNSLGAGAIAIAKGDSLYRIGPCEEGSYRVLAEGPVRSVLELTYKNVPAGDRFYNVVHRISIFAGDRFYRSQVSVDGLQGDEKLATGIVNLHHVKADTFTYEGMKILCSLGNQGYSGEILGMAVITESDLLDQFTSAPDSGSGIVSTHLALLKIDEQKPAEYRFVAVWENRDPMVKDTMFFRKLLMEAAWR